MAKRGSTVRSPQTPQPLPSRVLLVGNPNVGKSVIFNLLTGSYAVVSNYPGTTVEVTRGRMRGLGKRPEVIDTPGTNSLIPLSVDEMVTRDMILNEEDYVVLQVIDARNLTRGLRITAQLAELGVPMVVALNMMDEATAEGIYISAEKLADLLGVEVVPTVAVERRGIPELFQALRRARRPRFHVHYAPLIEHAVAQISAMLPDLPLGKRGIALMLLAGDSGVRKWLAQRVPAQVLQQIEAVCQRAAQQMGQPLDYVIASQAWAQCDALAEAVTVRRPVSVSRFRQIASSLTMHPVWGVLILVAVLYAMYLVVGKFGAGTVVDWFSSSIIGSPPDVVMALGDREAPGRLAVKPAADIEAEGARVVIRPRGQPEEIEVTISPGQGCPMFLRPDASYSLNGRVKVDGDAVPKVAVVVTYRERPSEELVAALKPVRAGDYQVGGTLAPSHEGGRYYVAIRLSKAAAVTIDGLTLQRDAEGIVNPWLYGIVTRYVPTHFLRALLVGDFGVISMGLTLAIGVVLPIVTFFFLFFAVLEDSGYLARLTVLANRVFNIMGLNGRAVVPMVLGLGCDTMATLAARVLDTAKARLIVTFLLALGVPCSAQLGVVMAMASDIGPAALAIVFGVVIAELFAAGYVASKVIPGPPSDFIVEIPLLRMPVPANVIQKTLRRAEWFLREAMPYFLLGTGALAVMQQVGLLQLIQRAMQPVLQSLLSLPPEASYAFLVGFLRRDYGAAGLFDLRYDGRLDNLQTVVALVTMTLFVPCLANFLVMVKEQGVKRGVAMVAIIVPLAILTGAALNFVLRGLGVTL